jgi:hypothetical protein
MGDSTIRDGQAAGATTRAPGETGPGMRDESSAFNFKHRAKEQGLTGLVSELADEGSHLARQQVSLIEAEVRAATTEVKESIAAMAGAAVVGIAGLGVFLMGISFLLGSAMPLWLGTVVVAVATLAGAYAMYATGRNKIQSKSMTLGRTRHTIERAPAALSGQETEVRHGR